MPFGGSNPSQWISGWNGNAKTQASSLNWGQSLNLNFRVSCWLTQGLSCSDIVAEPFLLPTLPSFLSYKYLMCGSFGLDSNSESFQATQQDLVIFLSHQCDCCPQRLILFKCLESGECCPGLIPASSLPWAPGYQGAYVGQFSLKQSSNVILFWDTWREKPLKRPG